MDKNNIINRCNSAGLNIREVAEKIGMTYSGLYAALRNNTLKVETLERIAYLLKIDVADFFYNESDFITDGSDLKRLIVLYKELLAQIIDDNPALVNRERVIKQFETYNNLFDLDKYNWVKGKWG